MFSKLYEVFSIFNKIRDEKIDREEDIRTLLGKSKSLTDSLRKSTINFPIIVSRNVLTDDTSIYSVITHLQAEFGRFILMSNNLNPVIDDKHGGIKDYIDVFFDASETDNTQNSNNSFNSEENIKEITLNVASKEECDNIISYIRNSHEDYEIYETESKTQSFLDNLNIKSLEDKENDDDKSSNNRYKKINTTTSQTKDLEKQLNFKSGPTIIKLNFVYKIGENLKDMSILVAIKGVMHLLNYDEMLMIFENYAKENSFLQTIIKLTTGEISFFRDFVFQLDKIKKEQKFKKKYGRHNWFRILEANKTMHKVQKFSQVIGDKYVDILKKTTSNKFTKTPLFSIVTSYDELEAGTRIPIKELTENHKYILKIMDSLMLLCMVIVVESGDKKIYKFYFSGIPSPAVFTEFELQRNGGGNASNDVAVMNTILNNVAKLSSRR